MGYNFTQATMPDGYDGVVTCAAWGNDMYLAIQGLYARALTSRNGDVWEYGGNTFDTIGLPGADTVFWSPSGICFVYINFNASFLQITTDGITWSLTYDLPPLDSAFGNLAWDGDDGYLYILAKYGGINTIYYTDNPVLGAWTAVAATDPFTNWSAVATNGTTAVVVGESLINYTNGSGPTIQLSTDTNGYDDGQQFTCVSYGNGVFIAGGVNQPTFSTSGDGRGWAVSNSPNYPLFSKFGNQNFVFWDNGTPSTFSGSGNGTWNQDTTTYPSVDSFQIGNQPGSHIAGISDGILYSDIFFHYDEQYGFSLIDPLSQVDFAIPFQDLPTGDQIITFVSSLGNSTATGHFEGNNFIITVPPVIPPEGITRVYFEPIIPTGTLTVDSVTPTTATFTWTSQNATLFLHIYIVPIGISIEDLSASGTTTATGLTPGTSYTAYLIDGNDQTLAQVDFMTPTGSSISFGLTWFFAP